MNSNTHARVIIFSLIAVDLLFLSPDQICDPSLNKNQGYSFVPGARDKQNIDRTTRASIEQAYGKLPMRFEANEGQTDARVKFLARGAGYSTYIGGIGTDTGTGIPVDGAGAAYISGQTTSSDFPANPIRPAIRNLPDAYVLKINPAGDAIVFGSMIGGDGGDSATAVSVDPGGNIYLAGSTSSTNFPLQSPLQTSRRGILDAFAVKIDASGSTLLFSTYLGGEGIDGASALAVAGDGNLYLTGSTDSGDFPLVNAFQTVRTGSGAYASDNGGASWSEIGNGLSGGDANDLVIFTGASSTIFAGTDRGVFKSVDGGSSWTLLGGPQFIRNINQLIVDPTSQDIL